MPRPVDRTAHIARRLIMAATAVEDTAAVLAGIDDFVDECSDEEIDAAVSLAEIVIAILPARMRQHAGEIGR